MERSIEMGEMTDNTKIKQNVMLIEYKISKWTDNFMFTKHEAH